MKISTTTERLRRFFDKKTTFKIIREAGFDCADLNFSLPGYRKVNEEYDNYINEAAELKEYADSIGLSINQAHAPFHSSTGNCDTDREIFKSLTASMKIASLYGVKNIIIHPKQHLPYRGNEKALFDMNMEFYRSLIPYCEEYGITVCVENMWQNNPHNGYITHSTCSKPEEFCEYIDTVGSHLIRACLDIGHTALVDVEADEAIRMLGRERLVALHMHDTDYKDDLHSLPGMSKIPYDKVVDALAEIGYTGDMTLEADGFLTGFEADFLPEAEKFMAKRTRFLADRFEAKQKKA